MKRVFFSNFCTDRERSSTEIPEMTAAFARIVEERLGQRLQKLFKLARKFLIIINFFSEPSQSDIPALDSPPGDPTSRDHRPIGLKESIGVARRLSMGGEGAGPVVDEEAMQQSLEFSQKLKIESLSECHFQLHCLLLNLSISLFWYQLTGAPKIIFIFISRCSLLNHFGVYQNNNFHLHF